MFRLGLFQLPAWVFLFPELGAMQLGGVFCYALNAPPGVFGIVRGRKYRVSNASCPPPPVLPLRVFHQVVGQRFKTAFVHLQAVGVGRPHPLFLPNPAAFYLVAGKLAFQNDVMVKTDGLLPCVRVCVLVFRHCNGFRGGQPSGFALCP